MEASTENAIGTEKIRSFTGLKAWRAGHQLLLMIYGMTKSFPPEEVFGLTSQMRRAAVSITSNIAEGFNRRSKKEKIHFYFIGLASLTETQNQLLASKDISYTTKETFMEIANQSILVSKLLNGLIKSIQR